MENFLENVVPAICVLRPLAMSATYYVSHQRVSENVSTKISSSRCVTENNFEVSKPLGRWYIVIVVMALL